MEPAPNAARTDPGAGLPPSQTTRLHSWKEIAAYLQRDVRTVQRWEKHDSLPIHRRSDHVGGVFAFRSELDAWWTNKQGASQAKRRRKGLRYVLWAMPAILSVSGFAVWKAAKSSGDGQQAGTTPPSLSIRRLWTGTGAVPLVALSPDRRYLTFSNPANGNLAVMNLATGRQRELTGKRSWFDSPEFARASRISPDNSLVAYAWVFGNGRFELRLASLAGAEVRTLYALDDATFLIPAAWSPDSSRILTIAGWRDGGCSISLVSARDASRQLLQTFGTGCPVDAVFSPDGREVIWSHPPRAGDQAHDVYAFSLDQNRERALFEHTANDRPVGWTGHGRALLFTSDRSGSQDLWALPFRDGRAQEPVLVKRELGRTWSVGVTQDGAMYYAASVRLDDVYVAAVDPVTRRVVDRPSRLGDRAEGANSYPDWSADGERLAYVRVRFAPPSGAGRPRFSIVIWSARNGTEREVVPRVPFREMYRPRWSPDGRTILLTGTDDAWRFGIHAIAVADGAVRPVEVADRFGHADPHAAWSPDGRALLFMGRSASGQHALLSKQIDSGEERLISHETGALAVAPDGRRFALGTVDRRHRKSALSILAAGERPRRILELDGPDAFVTTLAWTPDGRYLLFTKPGQTPEEPTSLWRMPATGGAPEPLQVEMPGMREVRMNRDGRRVTFFAQQTRTEVWLLENWRLPQ